jgi:hypothetical protein
MPRPEPTLAQHEYEGRRREVPAFFVAPACAMKHSTCARRAVATVR